MLDGIGKGGVVVAAGDVFCHGFDLLLGVCRGNGDAHTLQQSDVVEVIADGHGICSVKAKQLGQPLHPLALVYPRGVNIQQGGFRKDGIELLASSPMASINWRYTSAFASVNRILMKVVFSRSS